VSTPRLIVVANRLPVAVEKSASGIRSFPSNGGLVTALSRVLAQTGGYWIGWSGTEPSDEVAEYLQTRPLNGCSLVPVFLTAAEKRCFYHGCSNEILWPLFHDLQTRCNFDPEYWEAYKDVTEKFADAVEAIARPADFVWVHDYHLMLLGDALSARGFRAKLAYFHHIPFPPPDIFEKLPWRHDILRGLLKFSTVGFQTVRDQRNFIASLRRYSQTTEVHRLRNRLLLRANELCTTAGVFPISIDFNEFESLAAAPRVQHKVDETRRSFGAKQLVLGVDRLDYTKGIPERILGFQALLKTHPELHGSVSLLQIVVPSREDISSYSELRTRIERMVEEVNGEFGLPGWTPILYMHRCLDREELAGLYAAADVALVTPLKDGMNLVAKEFCASRVDNRGVLVLSEFAGAAAELSCGALLLNPYDIEGTAAAILRGLQMSPHEQRLRMQQMREVIRRNDVFAWCRRFCGQAFTHGTAGDGNGYEYSRRNGAPQAAAHAVA
jgi:alpha,alpha-trehalose-phosphate synthase [UDP-forming]